MPLYDFYCEQCDEEFEDIQPMDVSEVLCKLCCNVKAQRIMSAVNLGFLNDPERKKESLARRSYEHSMKEAKKNAEQIASKVGGVAKPQSPWNIRSQKKNK